MLQVDGDRLQVDFDERQMWVHAVGLLGIQLGEYEVVDAGHALERMDQAEAKELLAFYASLKQLLNDASR